MTNIYVLRHPETKEIRYVGKTTMNLKYRLSRHIWDSNNRRTNHKTCWIYSLNKPPIIEAIDTCEDEDWQIIECMWIGLFKSWGFRLTNSADGGLGGGARGRKVSKETKLKIAKTVSENKERARNISKALTGRKLSNERKDQIRKYVIANQGRPILQYTLAGEYVRRWDSTSEAADYYSVDRSSVMRCCKGKFKTSAGFKWEYEDKDMVHATGKPVE